MINAEPLPSTATEEFIDLYSDVAPPFHQTARTLKLGKEVILSQGCGPISHYATLLIQKFYQNNVLYKNFKSNYFIPKNES